MFDVPSRILQVNCAVPTDSLELLGTSQWGGATCDLGVERLVTYPIGSMYGIFTYIWVIYRT